ncbi:hypothetical protein RclHR1_10530001 [Rhizophagus clarus]|uniref:V-SNARE-domain-containing protein n=1 Tax=Rhizophagus clarus TaxID=94130 RepID=A0A2Z6QT28_9GLOM|nr:hypothetical protein RclHR1_10530001 [Rhizophagus clarus]GET02562.1 V-SNARE-domain-containing protein [Rhizophagus clarus]
MSSYDLFLSYEGDFDQVSASIRNKINRTIPSQNGEKRKNAIRAAKREIEEAEEIILQMGMELLNIQQSMHTHFQERISVYKSDLEKLKRGLEIASSRVSEPSVIETDIDQRARLLTGTERLADSSRRLQDSHRIALETETIDANILEVLHTQREQILRIRDTSKEEDSYIEKAQRTIEGMARRVKIKHIIAAVAIITLITFCSKRK